MADESVVVELLMTASQFIGEAQKAAKAAEGVGKSSKQSADEGTTGFQKYGAAVRANSRELTAIGGTMLGVGAITTALALKVAKTGLEYNVLQQKSRAALKTLMGDTEAANAQMDKLNTFAKTSPFSKAVFIEAQQTMLGFGIAAEKVIPYLDAIQNSVAAIGGTNQDISEITQVLAKVQSSGKMTAVTLMELGKRGIDAATLMGSAMGKTGAEIRKDITEGAIGAQDALDALSKGMMMRFGGAAANVKETFVGATDRVKAAFRDLSASAMEPFVGSKGGGLFVGWLNNLADMLRLLDKMPPALKTTILLTGLLGGAALTAGGSFLMLIPKIVELRANVAILEADFPRLVSPMRFVGMAGGAITAALAIAAAGFAYFGAQAAASKARVEELAQSLDRETGAFTKNTREIIANRAVKDGLDKAMANVGVSGKIWTDAVLGQADAANKVTGAISAANEKSKQWHELSAQGKENPLNTTYSEIVALEESIAALQAAMPRTVSELGRAQEANEFTAEAVGENADATTGATAATDEYGNAVEDTTASLKGYLEALKGVVDFEKGRAKNFADLESAEDKQLETLAKMNGLLEQNGATLDQNTEAGRNNRAYLRDLQDAYHDTLDAMISMTDAQGNATYSSEEMTAKTQAMRDEFIATATQMGATSEQAAALADSFGLIPEQVATQASFDDATAKANLRALLAEYDQFPKSLVTYLTAYGDDAESVVAAVAEAMTAGIPESKITEILAKGDDAIATVANVQATIDSVEQKKAANLRAFWLGGAQVIDAQAGIDSVRQKSVPSISVDDNASPTIRDIRSGLDGIQSKTITVTTKGVSIGAVGGMIGLTRAAGGPVFGPGTATSDSSPAWLSNNEHVLTAREVMNLGGHKNVYALRQMMRSNPSGLRGMFGFADGGTPSAPSYVPAPLPFSPRTNVVVPAPVLRPQIMVQAVVENPFTGEEVEGRVASTVVKYIGG